VKPSLLELAGVGAGYQALQVVWDVDLHVDAEEWLGLVGASGSGKTALVRTIAGLNVPFGGVVRFAGSDLASVAAHDRVWLGLAVVPEGRHLFAGMTVRENLMLGGFAVLDPAALGERIDEVHRLFPVLAERRDQIAGTLSGGEQQMCAIGRALMAQPKLLVVDELSAGLAPAVVETILDALLAIRRRGTALFVIDQDAGIALSFAHRAYVMRAGRIVMEGAATRVLSDPALQREYIGY
jgi:branched-chain amino acid transport system ATP-binding protein